MRALLVALFLLFACQLAWTQEVEEGEVEEGGSYRCRKGYYRYKGHCKKRQEYYGSGMDGEVEEGEVEEGGSYRCRKGYYRYKGHCKKRQEYYGSGMDGDVGEIADEGASEGTHYYGYNQCHQGYWNDNGYCRKCYTHGCRVCQPPHGEYCTQCKDGYKLEGNSCKKYYY